MTLTFGSLFSGAGGLDAGFHNAGFTCRWQVELDRTCRSVLARHWPQVPRFSDVRAVGPHNLCPVDVIVGGFPCQNLSTAGNRAGLAGEKSGLWWEMLRVIRELRPRFVVWENVAGLLSSDGGRDLRRVCGSLAEHGYFGLVRTLDAQHFGVPQRRRRLFGVFATSRFNPGDGGRLAFPQPGEDHAGLVRLCAAVLAVGPGSGGDPPPRRKAGSEVAGDPGGGAEGQGAGLIAFGGNNTGGQRRGDSALSAKGGTGRIDFESETFIVHGENSTAMTGNGSADVAFPAEVTRRLDSTGGFATNQGGTIVVAQCHGTNVGPMGALRSGNGNTAGGVPFVAAFNPQGGGTQTTLGLNERLVGSLSVGQTPGVVQGMGAVAGDAGDRTHALTSVGADASEDGTGRDATEDLAPTLRAMAHSGSHANAGGQLAVAFAENQQGEMRTADISTSLAAKGGKPGQGYAALLDGPDVRRLTPTECERLMGWEVGWTEFTHTGKRIKDGPRYRMLGNGVVMPVALWLARRLRDHVN